MASKFENKHIKIQDVAETLKENGIDITPLLLQGPTVETIIEEGHKVNVDL